MTKGEAVSMIMNKFRALTQDRRLSRRYVLREIDVAAKFIIEQKVNDGSIFINSLYEGVDCLELIPVDKIKCPHVELRTCKTLMRSKKKLPKPLNTKYGPMIREVTTIDSENIFKRVSKQTYRRLKMKRKDPLDKSYYYFFDNEYIWIPDVEIHSINLQISTFEDEVMSELSGCKKEDECRSGWDYKLLVPDDLLKAVLDIAAQSISVNRQIPIDENPNMNELEG